MPASLLDPLTLPAAPGTYCLWLRLPDALTLRVGRLGVVTLPPGLAVYVGSAHGPGGLRARVGRHLRAEKPLRWHIDHLTARALVCTVWYAARPERLECAWAAAIRAAPGVTIPARRFGSSDCACPAHLMHVPAEALPTLWAQLAPDGALGSLL